MTTRAEVFEWMLTRGFASETRLIQEFGRGVQEVISSLRDIGLVVMGHNRSGAEMWYPVER